MTFGEFVCMTAWIGVTFVGGTIIGALLRDIFGRWTTVVVAVAGIALLWTILCCCCDISVFDVLINVWEADLLESLPFVAIHAMFVYGVHVGQRYKILICRRVIAG